MRARLPVVAIAVLACAALPLAGCSSEQHSLDVKEGEPLHLGDVSYNVALSRFLNPHDAEDEGYLTGQPPTSRGQLIGFSARPTRSPCTSRLRKLRS